jgi:DNA-binding GntR family transcriptional regulator
VSSPDQDVENARPAAPVLVQSSYEAIKDAILRNRLRPGTKLAHRELAERLGVSRTPIRESLERLYQEGYVKRIPNRGYFVAEMDAREVVQLYETREALETFALRKVMESGLSAADVKRLRALNARYGKLCGERLDRERLVADCEFHVALAAQSGNEHLCRTLRGVFDRLIHKRRVEGFYDRRGLARHADHVGLLDAMAQGRSDEAEARLRKHIRGACTALLEFLAPSSDARASPLGPL